MLPLDRIYCGNNLDLIEEVDDESVDLVFYSPPYFDLHKYGESSQEIGHGQNLEQYLDSMARLNRACARVLKPTGNLVINVMDLVRNGRPLPLADMMVADVTTPQRTGSSAYPVPENGGPLYLIEKIAWFIRNKMPVANPRRFCNKFEWLIHLAKSDDYYFSKDSVREPHGKWGAIDSIKRPEKWNPLGKDPGNKWDFPLPGISAETLALAIHAIEHHPTVDQMGVASAIEELKNHFPEENVWDIKAYRVAGKRKFHKAGFPIELCDRVVQAWCPAGGVMLEPFAGSGTACLSAREFGRHFIGFELFPTNVEICEKRLSGELV